MSCLCLNTQFSRSAEGLFVVNVLHTYSECLKHVDCTLTVSVCVCVCVHCTLTVSVSNVRTAVLGCVCVCRCVSVCVARLLVVSGCVYALHAYSECVCVCTARLQ